MDIFALMQERHSVRKYLDKPIEKEKAERLQKEIDNINSQTGLNFQLMLNEPKAFEGSMANYGSFKNCKNYFALSAENGRNEDVGFYGEKLVLLAQELGLNTCWVAMTYSKSKVPVKLNKGEKLHIVIALGYGETQGTARKSKSIEELCTVKGDMPQWFKKGMECAVLAPTAMNQQKFHFTLNSNKVKAKSMLSPYAKTDLEIVKCHFELGAGSENFEWE